MNQEEPAVTTTARNPFVETVVPTKPALEDTIPQSPRTETEPKVERMKSISHTVYDESVPWEEQGCYFYYDGGEAELTVGLGVEDFEEEGAALWLFVDGKLQAFRTEQDPELTWWKKIDPRIYEDGLVTICFTPDRGKTGDTMEVLFVAKAVAEQTIRDEDKYKFVWSMPLRGPVSRIIMRADGEEIALPESVNRVLTCNISYEDLIASDIAGWSSDEMHTKVEAKLSVNGNSNSLVFRNYGNDTVNIGLELFGAEDACYGLSILVNNEPANIEEIVVFPQNGQKTLVDVVVNVSDLEEFSVIAVLSPKTYREDGWDDSFVSGFWRFGRQEIEK